MPVPFSINPRSLATYNLQDPLALQQWEQNVAQSLLELETMVAQLQLVPGSFAGVATNDSVTGTGSTASKVQLVNDVITPTNAQAYMYRNGARGWAIPTFINVLDYGADPTGASDSGTAIQNAINALTSGGVLYFPAGSYHVASAISTTNPIVFLGCNGFSSQLISTVTSGGAIFSVNSNASFRDLGFGSSVTQTVNNFAYISFSSVTATFGVHITGCVFQDYYNGISVINSTGTVIDSCYFITNLGGTGILVGSPTNTSLNISNCTWNTHDGAIHGQTAILVNKIVSGVIQNCQAQWMGYMILVSCSTSGNLNAVQQMVIHGCFCQTVNGGLKINSTSAGSISQISVTDCEFAGTQTDSALNITANSTSTITEVQVSNSSFYGAGASGFNVVLLNADVGAKVSDVMLNHCVVQSAVSANGVQINSTTVLYTSIMNCTITSNGGNGILVQQNVTDFRIVGNLVRFNTAWGIQFITGGQTGCIISLNDLRNNTSGTQQNPPVTGAGIFNGNNI